MQNFTGDTEYKEGIRGTLLIHGIFFSQTRRMIRWFKDRMIDPVDSEIKLFNSNCKLSAVVLAELTEHCFTVKLLKRGNMIRDSGGRGFPSCNSDFSGHF